MSPRSVIAQIGRQVSVFTFGFGEEHEADVLQAIADAGNGLYYFVSDVESIPDSFCDCLGGLLSVVAQVRRCVVSPLTKKLGMVLGLDGFSCSPILIKQVFNFSSLLLNS